MEQAGVQLIAAGGDVYISTINQATKATNTFVDATEKGGGGVSAAGQVMIGALRKVGEFAVDALGQAAKATASFLKDSVDVAGDFQQGMLEFQSVAGKDVDTKGLDKFHDLFISLGKELPVSTSEVQQAAIEMVKGGIDPAIVAAGGLKQNIQFAAAAMKGDLVAAAEVSAKILGGWADANATAQQKADFLTHSTDLLTKAANASSVDVHELSLGIFNAQGIAKTAGVSFDDLTTTLAALSPRFASSSEAGNSLKNVIARLQPTTDAATAAMQGLGLITADGSNKFYDAQGSFIGFEKASQLLQDSLKGLTDQQKQAVLQTIFGNDAMNAASGLAELGAAGYQHMADSLANANGVAEAGALKQQGFNTALENAKGSVEALQITIGEKLLPILTDLLNNVVAPAINAFTDWADAIFSADDPLQELISQIDQFSPLLGMLAKGFSSVASAGNDLGGVLIDLSGIWNKALKVVDDVGHGYLAVAQSILPIVSQFWADHGTQITTFLQTAYTKIMSIVNLAMDLYDAIVPKVLHEVAGWISEHATGIQAVLSGAWQAISAIIDGALTLIEGTLKIALDLINGDWSKAWTDLQQMSATFVLDIEQIIEGFLNIIAGFFNTSLAGIAKTWQDNWDMLVEIASKVADRMIEVGANIIQGIIDGIEGSAGRLFSTLKSLASDALQAAKDALGISSPSKAFAEIGQFAVEGIIQGLQQAWPGVVDLVSTLSDDLVSQVGDIGGRIQDAVASGFSSTATIDRQIVKNMDALSKMQEGFYKTATQNALQNAQDTAKAYADPAIGAKYFKMRSDQIFEFQKLQEQINNEENADEKRRLQDQQILILKAQEAEQQAFDAQYSRTQSAASDIVDLISKLWQNSKLDDLNKQLSEAKTDAERERIQKLIEQNSLPVNDTGAGHDLMALLTQLEQFLGMIPGRAAGGRVSANQPYWVGEHGPELFWPTANGMVSPAASSAQMAARAQQTTYNNTTSYSMPIYTNNSPAALQQSMAIMQASMP